MFTTMIEKMTEEEALEFAMDVLEESRDAIMDIRDEPDDFILESLECEKVLQGMFDKLREDDE